MAKNEAIGFVETFGLAAAVACADAGVKGANVTLLGYEYTKGDGMCTVKFAGNVGAVLGDARNLDVSHDGLAVFILGEELRGRGD